MEMVKRKADVNVDEWLAQRVGATESILNPATAAPAELTVNPTPIGVEINPGTGTVKVARTEPAVAIAQVAEPAQVAEDQGDVAVNESDAAEWFWLLLEQSGYERW